MVYFANDMHFRLADMARSWNGYTIRNEGEERGTSFPPFMRLFFFFFCGLIIVLDPTKDDKYKWIRLADHVVRRRLEVQFWRRKFLESSPLRCRWSYQLQYVTVFLFHSLYILVGGPLGFLLSGWRGKATGRGFHLIPRLRMNGVLLLFPPYTCM